MLTTTGRTTTVYVIGKCPINGCKRRRRLVVRDAPVVRCGPHTYTDWQIAAAEPYGTVRAGLGRGSEKHQGWGPRPSRYLANYRHAYDAAWFAAVEAAGWVCTDHDRFMVTLEVKGVVDETKPCTGACRSATGRSCHCVCGGEFHGSSWG